MAVYLINIALLLFWRLYFTQKRGPNSRKGFCTVAAVQWILISGLRDLSVGADTEAYYNHFEQTKLQTWRSVFCNLWDYLFLGQGDKDPGYVLFIKILQIFTGNYQIFLCIIACIFMGLMARWIYRHSASPCTSFLLFSTLFYSFYAITGHRQVLATALVSFAGYEFIRQRKFWKFTAVTFGAFLLHKSSLVFLPLYFIAGLPVPTGFRVLCAVGVAVVAVLGKRLYGPIALWIGYSESQIESTIGGAELYSTLLVALCILVWFLYPRIRNHRSDAPFLFHINVMTLISGLLVFQNQNFMRIQQYFSLFLMITVPEVINTVKREYRLVVYWLFGAVMILYLMRNHPQYQFFFLS